METAKCTTRKGKIPHYADGGLIGAIKRKFMPTGEAQKQSPPDKPTMAPMVRGSLDPKNALREREEAAGLKAGGAIRGKGGPTSDDIPIMASNGEFMIKAKAVEKLGVPALEALNAIADKPGDKKSPKAGHGAVRKMAAGGLILGADGVYRVNSAGDVKVPGRQYGVTNPRAATPVATIPSPTIPPDPNAIKVGADGRAVAPGQQYRLTGPAAQPPGTSLVTTGPGRSFTPPTIPNPQVEIPSNYTPPQVNSKTGAYTNVPPVAEPPAAAPAQPKGPGAVNRMNAAFTGMTGMGGDPSRAMGAVAKTGQTAVKAAGRLAAPLGVINEAVDVGKVAVDPNASGIDVATQASQGAARLASAGVGAAAGAAAGSVIPVVGTAIGGIAGGLLGYYGANKAIEAGRSAAGVDPRSPAERAPSLVAPAANAAPAPAATPAPGAIPATPTVQTVPTALQPQQNNVVTRVGNSYSGAPGISGDIQIANGQGAIRAPRGGVSSIDTSAGYAADLKALAEIERQKQGDFANIQAQERYAQDNVLKQKALSGNRAAGAILASRTKDQTEQRGQDIQAGAIRSANQLAREKLGVESTAQGIENRGKEQAIAVQQQIQQAQAEYLAAGDDPVKLKAAERKLAVLSGKGKDALQDEYAYAPGGQAVVDNQLVTQPGVIFNKRTGQLAQQTEQAPQLPPGMVKQVGTSGGRPVYLDKNGKQVIAKG